MCAGRPRRTDNLTSANNDMNDMVREEGGLLPCPLAAFRYRAKVGVGINE